MINSRQMAMSVWTIIVLLALVPLLRRNADLKRSVRETLRLLLGPKISLPILLLIGWNAAAIWALWRVGFWNRPLLADAVTLVIANSVPSLFRAATATYSPSFFLRTLGVTLGVDAVAEVLVNMYTFAFWIEMILVAVALLIGIGALCGLAAGHAQMRRLFDGLAAILGLGLACYSLLMAAVHFRSFASTQTFHAVLLPFVVATANLPILFAICVWLAYGDAFALLRLGETDPHLVRYKKWRVARTFGLNLARLQRFRCSGGYWMLQQSTARGEVKDLLRP
jgi:hypothetical protein